MMVQTIHKIARRIHNPDHDSQATTTLTDLIKALDRADGTFDINRLYNLNLQDFELAMELISDWRFRRYTQQPPRIEDFLAHSAR